MLSRVSRSRPLVVLGGVLALTCLGLTRGSGADYGRLSGLITDTQGNPLMGATVLIMGPALSVGDGISGGVERILTDGQGRFTAEHLLPGRYSIQVTSVTRLPASRNSVRVRSGETARENFVLADIFAPFQFHVPPESVSKLGEDWKWVLRTSAATRPVLRYAGAQAEENSKVILPPSEGLIAIDPGATRRQPLSADAGMGSVLAYSRPLSEDADLLVAGSMNSSGIQGSSVAAAFRKNVFKDDAQELALVVHNFGFSEGLPTPLVAGQNGLATAQGLVASYSRVKRLSDSLTLTAGMEIDYLNAQGAVMLARPRADVEYQLSPSNLLAFRYGTQASPGDGTLLERVGDLNAFPRVTLVDNRPRLEKSDHAELSFNRKLAKSSEVEVAAYRDGFQDAAVTGLGKPDEWSALAVSVLPNLSNDGVMLNAGQYSSTGLRVAFTQRVGSHIVTALMYATGEALTVAPGRTLDGDAAKRLTAALQPARSQIVAGKVSAQLPVTRTWVVASYGWVPQGSVTTVDPYGQANLEVLPYLGFQLRQPLPAISFLPAHVEAIADFRNSLGEGYVKLARAGDEPLALTPTCRSFRGGFSVQF
jgi:Carboxypeptidase regulatory-like domain